MLFHLLSRWKSQALNIGLAASRAGAPFLHYCYAGGPGTGGTGASLSSTCRREGYLPHTQSEMRVWERLVGNREPGPHARGGWREYWKPQATPNPVTQPSSPLSS